MNLTQIYATIVGVVFSVLIFFNTVRKLWRVLQRPKFFLLRHLIYPLVVDRNFFIGPWTRISLVLRLVYLSISVFFLTIFRAKSILETGVRAGALALINMIPLFFGLHLSFLADLCGISLKKYRCLHAAGAYMSFVLALYHVIVGMLNQSKTMLLHSTYVYGIKRGPAIFERELGSINSARYN